MRSLEPKITSRCICFPRNVIHYIFTMYCKSVMRGRAIVGSITEDPPPDHTCLKGLGSGKYKKTLCDASLVPASSNLSFLSWGLHAKLAALLR